MPTTIVGESGVSQVQNNTITQADLTTAILPLGVGQSWVNMTGVRAAGQTYTNDTGRPIYVAISLLGGAPSGVSASLIISGVTVASVGFANTTSGQITGIVPAGATYGYTQVNTTLNSWAELR